MSAANWILKKGETQRPIYHGGKKRYYRITLLHGAPEIHVKLYKGQKSVWVVEKGASIDLYGNPVTVHYSDKGRKMKSKFAPNDIKGTYELLPD